MFTWNLLGLTWDNHDFRFRVSDKTRPNRMPVIAGSQVRRAAIDTMASRAQTAMPAVVWRVAAEGWNMLKLKEEQRLEKTRIVLSSCSYRSIIDLFRSIHFGLTYWDVRCARTLGMSFGQPGSGVRFFEQCAIRLERSFHWACNWWTQGYDGYSVVWFIWYERR